MKENIEEILSKYELKTGAHKSLDEGACIMEIVSYIANEPWSDHPKCACPILTEYAIRMNDRFNDDHRQLLKPIIPLLLNSRRDDETQIARKRLIRWRNVTVTYPLILDCYKMTELANKLRAFGNNLKDMKSAAELLEANKKQIYANADAYAYAYAYANAYANADAYADADANAYAYAYAYAYATNAYANADAFRDKVAQAAVETLRLAALVGSAKESK